MLYLVKLCCLGMWSAYHDHMEGMQQKNKSYQRVSLGSEPRPWSAGWGVGGEGMSHEHYACFANGVLLVHGLAAWPIGFQA